jgi:hypothetical protein
MVNLILGYIFVRGSFPPLSYIRTQEQIYLLKGVQSFPFREKQKSRGKS